MCGVIYDTAVTPTGVAVSVATHFIFYSGVNSTEIKVVCVFGHMHAPHVIVVIHSKFSTTCSLCW